MKYSQEQGSYYELHRGKSDIDIEEGYRYSVYFQISFLSRSGSESKSKLDPEAGSVMGWHSGAFVACII